ncbi:hypothetical protein B0H13DRAFT_1861393 [Mycena leptocephala]|nr:hypothetical protein B0H13DRAFT_1861393 [Mycena leptocephala]
MGISSRIVKPTNDPVKNSQCRPNRITFEKSLEPPKIFPTADKQRRQKRQGQYSDVTALRQDIDAYTVNVDYKPLFTVLAKLAELHNPGSFRFFDRLVMFDNYPQKKKYLEDAGDEAKYYEEEATNSKLLRHETGKRLKVGVMSTWTSRPVGRDRKEWQLADMHCWLLVIYSGFHLS